jgi:hypothetical protein
MLTPTNGPSFWCCCLIWKYEFEEVSPAKKEKIVLEEKVVSN